MMIQQAMSLFKNSRLLTTNARHRLTCSATTTPSGAIRPEPKTERFGFLSVAASVILGLLIGATISKNVANFLEENELFVPSDDDDDDD